MGLKCTVRSDFHSIRALNGILPCLLPQPSCCCRTFSQLLEQKYLLCPCHFRRPSLGVRTPVCIQSRLPRVDRLPAAPLFLHDFPWLLSGKTRDLFLAVLDRCCLACVRAQPPVSPLRWSHSSLWGVCGVMSFTFLSLGSIEGLGSRVCSSSLRM